MNYYILTHALLLLNYFSSFLITFSIYQTLSNRKVQWDSLNSPWIKTILQSKCRRFRRINRNATADSRHSSCRLVSSALKNRSISIVCRNIVLSSLYMQFFLQAWRKVIKLNFKNSMIKMKRILIYHL